MELNVGGGTLLLGELLRGGGTWTFFRGGSGSGFEGYTAVLSEES